MFKALTEYVMRGRLQAITVALVGSWLPFVSQAVLGAVTLRKGCQEGLIVTLVASLPAFAGAWIVYSSTSLAYAAVAVPFIGYLACLILRSTRSWPLVLALIFAASALCSIVIVGAADNLISELKAEVEAAAKEQDDELSLEQAQKLTAGLEAISAVSVSGFFTMAIGLSTFVGVILARWWQALLYNPGGFQREFHQLRLNPSIAAVFALVAVVCMASGGHYSIWGAAIGLPLLFAGLGLVHWLVSTYRKGEISIIFFYFAAVLLVPLSAGLLMALALLDALLDIRNRFKTDPPQTD